MVCLPTRFSTNFFKSRSDGVTENPPPVPASEVATHTADPPAATVSSRPVTGHSLATRLRGMWRSKPKASTGVQLPEFHQIQRPAGVASNGLVRLTGLNDVNYVSLANKLNADNSALRNLAENINHLVTAYEQGDRKFRNACLENFNVACASVLKRIKRPNAQTLNVLR